MKSYNAVTRSVLLALSGSALISGSFSAMAQEQADSAKAERIEVTGSRIKRTDIEGANPVLVLDRQAIEATGLASVGDILQDLPAAGSAINTTFNNGGNGSTTVDLRNLGSNRVLVLINGRRWNPGLGGSVDLNNIPSSIIERIEVLKDGASSIYGSDAIAGVVNIFTRKDFEGAVANAYFGENMEGDGRVELYDFGVGATGDKSSAFLSLSYLQQGEIMAGDREISAVPTFGAPDGFRGSSSTPQGYFQHRNATNTPGTTVVNTLTPAGAFTPWVEPTSRYNFAPDNYLQTPSERTNLYAQATYELTDDISFQTEVFYGNRKSSQLLASTPLSVGALSSGLGRSTIIAADNIYNPLGYTLNSATNLDLISRRMLEAGPRIFNQDVDQYQWNAGFNGSFELGSMVFDWDLNNVYGVTQDNRMTTGLLNMQRVNQALLGPSTGCSAAAGCVALNLFGGQGTNGAGTITEAQINYISFTAQDFFETQMRSHSGNISTELFDLPGGAAGIAVGFETRRQSGFDQPDALIAAGITSGNSRQPTKGGYSLDEYYAELALPILGDMPGVEHLELSLAARTSDYSNFGETTNSKVGLKYKPISSLLIRGTFSEGFRAPTISELFLGQSDSFPSLTDPCANKSATELAALPGCAGVPANMTQPNPQIRITVGGNPNLEPEESESTTYGFVWSPEFVEGLEITLDRYNILVENQVGRLGAQSIANACANSGTFCSLVTRGPSGNIIDLFNGNLNTGEVEVTGADMAVTYKLADTGIGSLKFVFDGSYMEEYMTRDKDIVTGVVTETQNAGRAGDRIVIPRFRANFNTYWNMGDFEAVYRIRYTHHTLERCSFGNGGTLAAPLSNNAVEIALCSQLDPNTASATTTAQYNALVHYNEVEAGLWHDLSFGYNLADWNAKVTVGGVNVTDEEPAVSYSTFANSFDPTMYDVPGAFWYVRYSQSF